MKKKVAYSIIFSTLLTLTIVSCSSSKKETVANLPERHNHLPQAYTQVNKTQKVSSVDYSYSQRLLYVCTNIANDYGLDNLPSHCEGLEEEICEEDSSIVGCEEYNKNEEDNEIENE